MRLDALPPGEWVTDKAGVKHYRSLPDPEPLRQFQDLTILHILLETRRRERHALNELLRMLSRNLPRKAA